MFLRKLKKLFRKLKDERTELKEVDTNQSKDSQQWDLDYTLEPFTGLTPEYMEMSKFSKFPFPFWIAIALHKTNHHILYDCMS